MNPFTDHPAKGAVAISLLLMLIARLFRGAGSIRTTVTTKPTSRRSADLPTLSADAPLKDHAKAALGVLPIGLVLASADSPAKQLSVFDLQVDRWLEDPSGLNHENHVAMFCDQISSRIWLPHVLDRFETEPLQNLPLLHLLLRHFDAGRVKNWFTTDAFGSTLDRTLVKRVVDWCQQEGPLRDVGSRFCRAFKTAGCHVQLSGPEDLHGWAMWVSEGRW